MTGPIVAVLWDMDGTLILSEELHERAIAHVLETEGIVPPADLHERTLGWSGSAVWTWLRDEHGLGLSYEAWAAAKDAFYVANCAGLRPRPGALEAWRALEQRGIRQAVVSNSDRAVVNANLAVLRLMPEPVSVARNDVAEGKPHPAPYLRAAALLGVPADRCVAVEDSPPGAASAVAAGALTLAWPEMADLVFPEECRRIHGAEDVLRCVFWAGGSGRS